jgi:DnaJ-class molecular chaperone
VEVTTIEGSTGALKVAAGTKAAAYLRIKGRGAPKAVGNMDERGDHYFRLVVKDE